MNTEEVVSAKGGLSRRLFLKRAGQAAGIIAFLPIAAKAGVVLARDREAYFEHTILAMGTTARVGVYASSEREADRIVTLAFIELKRIEALFTIFDTASEISRINEQAGIGAVPVSRDTLDILARSIDYGKLTHRALDITVEPLMRLWGFRNASNRLSELPTKQQVNAALQYVGIDQIQLDKNAMTAKLRGRGARLDLGGVAVGFALDKMAAILRAEGVSRAFIDISGDMYAIGAPEGKAAWEVAIPDPNDPKKIIHRTSIKDEALATSGAYESYVTYRAMKFGHIMDPHEGTSAHAVLSSTVIAKTGFDADALSTASFVTGTRYSDAKYILVTNSGEVKVLG